MSITASQPIYSGPALFPPPQVTTKEVPAAVKRILNHRLFQGWMISTAVEDEAKIETIIPEAPPKRQKTAYEKRPQALEEHKIQAPEYVHVNDQIPVIPSNVPLSDRIRKAVWRESALVSVRLDGGWLTTSPQKRIRPTGGLRRSELGLYPSVGVGSTGTDMKLWSNDVSAIKERVLSKAAERRSSIPLSILFESKIIQSAVQSAQTYAQKKKFVSIASPNPNGGSSDSIRGPYLTKPSMHYVPAEDGGLRYASVSNAVVPRSLHELCMKNLLCGYCMSTITDSDTSISADAGHEAADSKSIKAKQKNKSKSSDDKLTVHSSATIDVARFFPLVSYSCGSMTYQLHQQCAHALHRDFGRTATNAASSVVRGDVDADVSSIIRSEIKLGAIYQYELCDDADCDICGRKGGILRYFVIDAKSSSFPTPSHDGWLAHIPCIEYLKTSGLLRPLDPSSSNFPANRFSCLIDGSTVSGDSKLNPTFTSEAVAANSRRSDIVSSESSFRRRDDVDGSSIALRQDEMDGRQDEIDGNDVLRLNEMDGNDVLRQDEMDSNDVLRQDEIDGNDVLRLNEMDGNDVLRQDEMDGNDVLRLNEMDGNDVLRQDEMDSNDVLRQNKMDGNDVLRQNEMDDRQDEMDGSDVLRQDEMDETSHHNEKRISLRLLANDCFSPYFPQSRFDQLYGHWRCALCGIQSGIVSRCIAACCTLRAHYLCASLAEANHWQLRLIVSSCNRGTSSQTHQVRTTSDCDPSNSTGEWCDTTLGIVCSLHAFN